MKEHKGLTQEKAKILQQKNGLNEIKEKKVAFVLKFTKWLVSPVALMLLATAILSLLIEKNFDFYFIVFLMLLNFSISFWQEKKADNAIEKLSKQLAIDVKVLRDREWKLLNSKYLVAGDIIELNMGDIIPADIKIIEEKNLSINEAALTGESLSKEKKENDTCFSGSFISIGWTKAMVVATGKKTYFGNILTSIDKTYKKSSLENDILSISKWLISLSLLAAIILTTVFLFEGKPLLEILTLNLSLLVAGIPISLPTVMTLIISFGVVGLAKKKVIVRRLSSLKDLANANLLLTDKTGTLTKNKISVEKIISYNGYSENEALILASFTTHENDRSPISLAILEKTKSLKTNLKHKIIDFSPFDSERKRSSAKVFFKNKNLSIRSGATQVIQSFCNLDEGVSKKFENDVLAAAEKGYRTIAVSVKDYSTGEKEMKLCGLLFFSDSLVTGAKKTIKFIKENGIKTKMLTGDHILIAERIAKNLGLIGKTVSPESFGKKFENLTPEEFEDIGVFAEISPIDKYDIVKFAQDKYVVAVTGDGVNDLPALKKADVSIAVKNAVDALKSSADINLMGSGVSVICDAIIESRKIFERLYSYSVYRISESFRIVLTITILGIFYGTYPLLPIQLILLALLNDIPIISLAFNRVKIATKPSKINARARLKMSALFGFVGVINSILFVAILRNILHFNWDIIQTLFFLKLTVSGHMLIYIAHIKERWYKYLPSIQVIWATGTTQIIATVFAATGIFMTRVSFGWIIFVWLWALLWMQVSEYTKSLSKQIPSK